jgi:uncharacterized protein YcfJ
MPVILAIQKAENVRIVVRSQPRQIVRETLSQRKNPSQERAGGVAVGVCTEVKSQYHAKKKEKKMRS